MILTQTHNDELAAYLNKLLHPARQEWHNNVRVKDGTLYDLERCYDTEGIVVWYAYEHYTGEESQDIYDCAKVDFESPAMTLAQ